VITLADSVGDADPGVTRILRRQPIPFRVARTVQRIAAGARRADVVFSTGLLFESVIGATLARRPVVAKIVGDEVWERAVSRRWTSLDLEPFQDAVGDARIRLGRLLRASSLRRVSRLVVPSAYTSRMVARWAAPPLPPMDVIYNAMETPAAGAPPPWLASCARPRLVMAGRLIPLKRIDGVIRMLETLPSGTLIIIGDGPLAPALRAMARTGGLERRVHFAGAVSQADVLAVMRESDVLVLNSTTENCPHVLLEAMSVGLPVVATRVGGVPELVEDGRTGWLVDADRPDDLARRTRQALEDTPWRATVPAAAAAATARFSWRGHVEKLDAVLRQAAAAR
jgi:glycosyltransferase involved in cell wall biosynthesis